MRPSEGILGVAFGTRADGDARSNAAVRNRIADELGVSPEWATVTQVHGDHVAIVETPGHHGEADALLTARTDIPLVVATADCLPVAVAGRRTIGLAHAGWRGVAAGVVPALVEAMRTLGDEPLAAEIGPFIGPCCYEVGPEVVEAVGGFIGETRWRTTSVDLGAAVSAQLTGLPVTVAGVCTYEDHRYASYRRDRTTDRQVTVAWLP